ncbi:hypothetical protein [Haloarchaeobius sp. HRN-SO-5]
MARETADTPAPKPTGLGWSDVVATVESTPTGPRVLPHRPVEE